MTKRKAGIWRLTLDIKLFCNCLHRPLIQFKNTLHGSGETLCLIHYNDVIMGAIASQITSLTIVYSIVYSDADQRKHQISSSLAFVR